MSRSENLPTLPQAASHVLRLADNPDSNPREIERAIETDPAITAKILKIANSAYYGSNHVPTVGRAISFLGLTTVKSVVVSIAMQQMVNGKNTCIALNKLELWKHILAVATGARIIGKLKMQGKSEELYCAGMMHEIGLLAMEKFVPQELHAALVKAKNSNQSLLEVETQVMGFNHADVGLLLTKNWSLSPLIQDAISGWFSPNPESLYFDTTAVIAISKMMANSLGYSHSELDPGSEVDLRLAEAIELPQEQFGIIGEVITSELAKAQDAFKLAA